MTRTQSPATALAGRLCRPQRIGVFGHRGVGKTTLLTMLYREAVGGRLPGLRLAAADARTANYLSDKVLQLESGQPLPATLGETELRFHLYHQGARLDLLVMDYQGEHVALGRAEPIREFLRECDAVWLCLDAPVAAEPASCLRAQQEVEQLVEDYLGVQDSVAPHRPMALVVTKSDLLGPLDSGPGAVQELAADRLGMTRHALESHCCWHGLFAVSSLGGPLASLPAELADPASPPAPPFRPRPSGLEGPLAWLAEVLQAQDQARLERLWELAPHDLSLLGRAVTTFARRYPDAPAARTFEQRRTQAKRQRLRRRSVAVLAAALALVVGVRAYDYAGERGAVAFAAQHAEDPVAVRQRWHSFRAWHPTRDLLRPAAARAEEERLANLDRVIHERRREQRLAELRRQADDPDADAEAVWAEFRRFHDDFPEHSLDGEWQAFRARIKGRRDARVAQRQAEERGERERRALQAFRDLERAEQAATLAAKVELADRFLRDYAGTARAAEVEKRRLAALRRLDQHDIESARDYSARNPLNFYTRRQRYQRYLDGHPQGAFVSEASAALKAITAEWDRYDFRAVRDYFQAKPGDVKELKVLCRAYLAAHPEGKFRSAARDLLRWSERVTVPGEYRVVLKSGSFDKGAAYWLSRGLSLSVEIEVAGVRYGPSTIVKRSYEPEWNYEFPRRVRWRLGDGVRIWVTDHYFWRRKVLEVGSGEDDLLAMRLLSGEVSSGPHRLTFESDFTMPTMPKIE